MIACSRYNKKKFELLIIIHLNVIIKLTHMLQINLLQHEPGIQWQDKCYIHTAFPAQTTPRTKTYSFLYRIVDKLTLAYLSFLIP